MATHLFRHADKPAQLKQIAGEHLRVVAKRQHDEITREADRDDKEIERYTAAGFNLEELMSHGLMHATGHSHTDTASSVADSSPAPNSVATGSHPGASDLHLDLVVLRWSRQPATLALQARILSFWTQSEGLLSCPCPHENNQRWTQLCRGG